MAHRTSAIKEQGFSEAVAARIEALQRGLTRSVYEAKWTIFTKRCLTHQVDFRAPPVNSVADYHMYLFQDRKLQPSTIDSYRSAIADKLGNSPINISKAENLTRLLDSFNTDRQNPFLESIPVLPLGRANVEVRFMLGLVSLYPSPSFFSKLAKKRVQRVWPQWLYQPWPQLWIGPASLTGPSVWS